MSNGVRTKLPVGEGYSKEFRFVLVCIKNPFFRHSYIFAIVLESGQKDFLFELMYAYHLVLIEETKETRRKFFNMVFEKSVVNQSKIDPCGVCA